MPFIQVDGLRKTFTVSRHRPGARGPFARFARETVDVHAVDGISFGVEPGEMVGYIGPNGAGKSTTIKLLTGILVPSGGRARVMGLEPYRNRVQLVRGIGMVFGQRTQLWWDLPLRDSFDLLRYIYRVPADRFRTSLDAFVELLDLG